MPHATWSISRRASPGVLISGLLARETEPNLISVTANCTKSPLCLPPSPPLISESLLSPCYSSSRNEPCGARSESPLAAPSYFAKRTHFRLEPEENQRLARHKTNPTQRNPNSCHRKFLKVFPFVCVQRMWISFQIGTPSFVGVWKIPTKKSKMSEYRRFLSGYTVVSRGLV